MSEIGEIMQKLWNKTFNLTNSTSDLKTNKDLCLWTDKNNVPTLWFIRNSFLRRGL